MIPGLTSQQPNDSVRALKQKPWTSLPSMLGKEADAIACSMLLDCGLFIALTSGHDNLYQLSGVPLSEVPLLKQLPTTTIPRVPAASKRPVQDCTTSHKPNAITFVRNRMLYARPSLNGKHEVRFGMKHIHVFNRFSDHNNYEHIVHNMKYMFPRQFGLHNVFTSEVDTKETVQAFKDYTLRDTEIAEHVSREAQTSVNGQGQQRRTRLPRRLRGGATILVRKMLRNHQRCAYTQLLRHYCPVRPHDVDALSEATGMFQQTSTGSTRFIAQLCGVGLPIPSASTASSSQLEEQPLAVTTFSTPAAKVSAFCQSVVRRVLPRGTFGIGPDGYDNMLLVTRAIDQFIRMRRFESMSLHEAHQGIKLSCIPWLCPPNVQFSSKMSQSDRGKRLEILLEFTYHLFDSFLIPLVRSHFYVTESSTHRNQLFYFRHDVWRRISEPSLAILRLKVLEDIKPVKPLRSSASRMLGSSTVRLLPKSAGVRPIMNLRRRSTKSAGGRTVLGPSINSLLAPVLEALNYEKTQQTPEIGSALFSVGEIHGKILQFKQRAGRSDDKPLFFAKVDVQTCFDTIPQKDLIRLVKTLIASDRYAVGKHADFKLVEQTEKPTRRFASLARPANSAALYSAMNIEERMKRKRHTVTTDTGSLRVHTRRQLLKLLEEHVEQNVVKIGKRYLRQKQGIPQGSVLSSLLCSFFYGEFEQQHLNFLKGGESLLFRLVDDFLLVSTNKGQARQFLEVMATGNAAYGIAVNTKKSLANFEVTINGVKIPRHHGTFQFPYCGMLIDTKTLEMSKDRDRKDVRLSNSLTVQHSCRVGQTFQRKVLSSLKIQMHAMLLDTSLNKPEQVASTIYRIFIECAMKMHAYLKSLPVRKRPTSVLLIDTIRSLTKLAINLTSGPKTTKFVEEWSCSLTKKQILLLAAGAFTEVLTCKQTAYRDVLYWLDIVERECAGASRLDKQATGRMVEESRKAFKDYRF